MLSHGPAIRIPHFLLLRQVFLLIGHLPGQPNDIRRRSPRRFDDLHDVLKGLLDLADEIVAFKYLIAIPADLSADIKAYNAFCQHAIGVPSRGLPTVRMNNLKHFVSPICGVDL